jgi:hypothetical protein
MPHVLLFLPLRLPLLLVLADIEGVNLSSPLSSMISSNMTAPPASSCALLPFHWHMIELLQTPTASASAIQTAQSKL